MSTATRNNAPEAKLQRNPAQGKLFNALGRYRWEAILLAAVIGVFIYGAITTPAFARPFSLGQMIAGSLEIAIIGIGVAMLMIVGEIDISVGSVMGLTVTVLGQLFSSGVPLLAAIGIVLVMGAAIGALNGTLVLRLAVPSLVITVAALALYRGLSYVILGSEVVGGYPKWFTYLNTGRIGIFPVSTIIYIVLFAVAAYILHRTKTGRRMFAIGTSTPAARYAGVRVRAIKVGLFITSSTFAAVAGVMYTARLASSSPNAAVGFELYAITVALLGGISVFGGRGTLVGVFLATVLVMEVRTLLSLLSLPGQVQDLAVGVLLILVAVIFAFNRGGARSRTIT